MSWWHRHKYEPVEIKYPVLTRIKISTQYEPYQEVFKTSSAVYYKCKCGDFRVVQMLGKRKIWRGSIIEVEENEVR